MLRITFLNDTRGAIFKMEGKLAQEWVPEAEEAWITFSSTPPGERVVIDLCGVSFIDDPGRELLARMHSAGAKLIGSGPMTSALIDEICGDGHRRGSWLRGFLSLFLLLPLATVIGHGRILINRPSKPAPGYSTFEADWPIGELDQKASAVAVSRDHREGVDLWKGFSQ